MTLILQRPRSRQPNHAIVDNFSLGCAIPDDPFRSGERNRILPPLRLRERASVKIPIHRDRALPRVWRLTRACPLSISVLSRHQYEHSESSSERSMALSPESLLLSSTALRAKPCCAPRQNGTARMTEFADTGYRSESFSMRLQAAFYARHRFIIQL